MNLRCSRRPRTPTGGARIVAALVNDTQSPEVESVTLLNPSPRPLDLSGWSLADKNKKRHALSGVIPAGDTVRVRIDKPMELSNQGGIITLLNEEGLKVHGVAYTKVAGAAPGLDHRVRPLRHVQTRRRPPRGASPRLHARSRKRLSRHGEQRSAPARSTRRSRWARRRGAARAGRRAARAARRGAARPSGSGRPGRPPSSAVRNTGKRGATEARSRPRSRGLVGGPARNRFTARLVTATTTEVAAAVATCAIIDGRGSTATRSGRSIIRDTA